MATGAKLGYGTLFQRGGTASPLSYSTLGEVRKIGDFGSKRGLVEVTNMDSANSSKEYISSLKDGVEFPVTINFTGVASQTQMLTDHDNASLVYFQIVLPSSLGTFSFAALVLEWKLPADPNAGLEMSFTLKISGPITKT